MSVIQTDQWLQDSYHQPIELCKKLEKYFRSSHASEIYDYLTQVGMYQSFITEIDIVGNLQKNNVWEIVAEEKRQLQKAWSGPSIPIFILPADHDNSSLRQDFNGKSGLAFKDKLFLFLSVENTELEIKALFTHEYNHVCRLSKFAKSEGDYVLLDTIILEGLAENAVRESLGEDCLASWTAYYSQQELEEIWHDLIYPNRFAHKNSHLHQNMLFGLHPYPKMLGYCVGYYLVQHYLEATKQTSKDILAIRSELIAQLI